MSDRPALQLARTARAMHLKGCSTEFIASQLSLSKERIKEYLERNTHPKSCPSCQGYGINKDRSSGVKTPLCEQTE